jgi:hypothetical protein
MMTLTDMNKWTSGETEAFFDPRQTLSVAGDDANLGEGTLPAHPSALKFVHFAIAAAIGAPAPASRRFVDLWRGPPARSPALAI